MTEPTPHLTTSSPQVTGLGSGWTVRTAGGPVPAHLTDALAGDGPGIAATVPGSVHTDLLAADLIPDPYLDDHERLLGWIGRCDWEYRTTFTWSDQAAAHDRHDLVFDGLDTVATVLVNGTVVAHTANQHRSYRFDVGALLRAGENELVVRFASPVRYADAQSLQLGYRPQVNHHPFNAIRKVACNFGWDWGIDAATCGIWRPARLESWSVARLASVRALPGADLSDSAPAGLLDVHVEVEWADGASSDPVEVEVAVRPPGGSSGERVTVLPSGGSGSAGAGAGERVTVARGDASAVVHLRLDDAELWWPRGYGDQPLYDVEVRLGGTDPATSSAPGASSDAGTPSATGTSSDTSMAGVSGPAQTLDRWDGRTGFRDVRLDMTPDDEGTSFTILVNDQPVWAKGANWIPDDVFFHRVDRARYERRLDQAVTANLNLLRVWGGGLYESGDFYAACDERGILVWQDFAFACAAYSEAEPLAAEVEAEAREAVTRLAPHPSLVMWNGSNENIWGWHDWGWKLRLDGKSWGLGYYTRLLPDIVAELDGTRPYTPSSPWSGSLDIHPNDVDHGSMHSWDLWNELDWPHYRDKVPRFMAEFGWQAPPAWTTLRRSISDVPLTPESPGMQVHQKAMEGNKKLTDGLLRHAPQPDDMEDWHWAMQWNQAVAVRTAVEHLRSWAPRCMGSVVWQLNDCWPVTSWSAVDGDERPKPLLYAMARAHADRMVTVQPRAVGPGAGDGGRDGDWVGGDGVDGRVRSVGSDGGVGMHVGDGGAGLHGGAGPHGGAGFGRGGDGMGLDDDNGGNVDGLAAVVVNDSPEPWTGEVELRRLAYDGKELAVTQVEFSAAAREVVTVPIPLDVATPGDAGRELIVASVDGRRAEWFFVEPRDSELGAADLITEVESMGTDRVAVRVTARGLVRDLTLLADKAHPDAVADTALVTLLPGESATFEVSLTRADGGAGLPDAALLTSPRVLRSLNQLVS